ncbi:MAG: glycosyl transferase family 2 [Nitrospirae bacterium GWC2_56_14]|nr:MAG: glycosyl transferase family 2 [Nitrospirae bacterium GWC2_56_14]
MKLLVIVPAYNEQESLPGVIRDLRDNVPGAEILVVNDGSRDATSRTAVEHGVKVVDLPFNLGIGGAMQTGFLYAREQGYEFAVQFDGDGQHRAEEMQKILEPLRSGTADLVIGSRFLNPGGYRVPFFRRAGIWIFSAVLSRILGMTVSDSTSGFRAANRRVLEFFSETYPEDYPEVEALVLLHKKRLRMVEVPVGMRERTGGSSSITPLRSVYYMIKVLLAIFVDLIKKVR